MIIRGTTPTISFNINSEIDLNEVAEVWITFKTKPGSSVKEITFTKSDDEVIVDAANNRLTLMLSQEQTLEFTAVTYNIQIRLRMNDGLAYASKIIDEPIGKVLKDGVI